MYFSVNLSKNVDFCLKSSDKPVHVLRVAIGRVSLTLTPLSFDVTVSGQTHYLQYDVLYQRHVTSFTRMADSNISLIAILMKLLPDF